MEEQAQAVEEGTTNASSSSQKDVGTHDGNSSSVVDGGTNGNVADGGTNASTQSSSSLQGLTADEVRAIVADEVGRSLADSEGRLNASAEQRNQGLLDAFGSGNNDSVVTAITADRAFSFVPSGTPAFVAQYMTPFLWGMAAGFVAFLIGYLWEAFARLVGLAGRK